MIIIEAIGVIVGIYLGLAIIYLIWVGLIAVTYGIYGFVTYVKEQYNKPSEPAF